MRAVKLYTNKILQFLTGGAGCHRLTCVVAVKWWLWMLLLYPKLLQIGLNPHTITSWIRVFTDLLNFVINQQC